MNWSLQLFSARNTRLAEALGIVQAAGYSSVEAYRENFRDVDAFQRALDAVGLTVPSMHINIGPLRDDPQGCMQLARQFDTSHVVCPYLMADERPLDRAGWLALCAELADIARRWNDAGFQFAWHNHDFEFIPLVDGSVPMQLLLEQAPELCWEIDVAWIVRSDTNPIPWIEQHVSRISAVHLKDIAPAGECTQEDGWADLGHGIVPWATIMPLLAQTPASIHVMEHDNPSDLQRFATRSIAAANALRPDH
jgi:sugar phosphate isomerase/epimerase